MRPAVFLDRDGTIIRHVHHLHRVEDVQLEPGAAEAIAALREAGFLAIVATNQSVVGRGLLTPEGLEEIHAVMLERLRGAHPAAVVDAIYWNPHLPPRDTEDPPPERKPGPGMLLRAANEHRIDLGASWMVGDSISDVDAGRRAGCRGSILVETGLGGRARLEADPATILARDLAEAAQIILASAQESGSAEAARR
ncbi:MAG: D-glycero-alpha-D-manno-heptose-1,7-bisphosphate 7-phosphatase [Phycisphaerales bacterium]